MLTKIIISASRRTDIPAFYMDQFMAGIETGAFHVKNPFNKRVSVVPVEPAAVHCIAFWSKDFSRFINGNYGPRLEEMGYRLFFLFTVNSASTILEPHTPALKDRIRQAKTLTKRFGARSVWWRFDPICFYRHGSDLMQNNLTDFKHIAEQMAGMGITRCITSFAELYAKVIRRAKQITGFSFVDPPLEKKIRVICKMADLLESLNISLYTCCENELLESLGNAQNIRAGGCISGSFLSDLHDGRISRAKDSGQRLEKGCRCTLSRDIGCYDAHPCFHDCLYCYARPKGAPGKSKEKFL